MAYHTQPAERKHELQPRMPADTQLSNQKTFRKWAAQTSTRTSAKVKPWRLHVQTWSLSARIYVLHILQ